MVEDSRQSEKLKSTKIEECRAFKKNRKHVLGHLKTTQKINTILLTSIFLHRNLV